MNDNGVDEFRWLVRQQKRKVQAVFSGTAAPAFPRGSNVNPGGGNADFFGKVFHTGLDQCQRPGFHGSDDLRRVPGNRRFFRQLFLFGGNPVLFPQEKVLDFLPGKPERRPHDHKSAGLHGDFQRFSSASNQLIFHGGLLCNFAGLMYNKAEIAAGRFPAAVSGFPVLIVYHTGRKVPVFSQNGGPLSRKFM